MKKIFNSLFALAFMLMVSAVFTACGDDEDDNSPKSMLVGTWDRDGDGSFRLTLTSSGKFDYYVYGSALTGKGDYTYDEASRFLTLFYNPKNSWGDRVYIVTTLTEKYLVITDLDGNTHSFRKRSSQQSDNQQSDNQQSDDKQSDTSDNSPNLCPDNNHPHKIDLGIGVKFACCNVGATTPVEYGNYYAWGEKITKSNYNWNTYKWCNGSYYTLTKYCNSRDYGTVDNKTQLEPADDAARANWGGTWRIPTIDELERLANNCAWTWTTLNNVNGYKVTGPNGKSVFLPAAGYCLETHLGSVGSGGYYWASSIYTSDAYCARVLHFSSSYREAYDYRHRCLGHSVRPVTE